MTTALSAATAHRARRPPRAGIAVRRAAATGGPR